MTSEGHHAGQPAEATSGGPTSGNYPPDADGQRISGRASAPAPGTEGSATSYGPPPSATPNGGSPFVVPAVSTFGAGSSPAGTPYGAARVPQPEEASPYGSVTPGNPDTASPYGSATPSSPGGAAQPYPAAGSPFAPPQPGPGSATPYGGAQSNPFPQGDQQFRPASPFESDPAAGQPQAPQSAWAPQSGETAPPPPAGGQAPSPFGRAAQPPAAPDNPFVRPAPADPGMSPGGLPTRTPGATNPTDDLIGGGGTPFSAFGDQPVRVPGASLSDLPAESGGGFTAGPAQNSWLQDDARPAETPQRPATDTFPSRRGDSGGFPLRAPAGPNTDADAPGLDLPIRSQQAFGNAPFPGSGEPEAPAPEAPSGGSGFPQRVPGAALSSGGSILPPTATAGSVPGSGGSLPAPAPMSGTAAPGGSMPGSGTSMPGSGPAMPVASSAIPASGSPLPTSGAASAAGAVPTSGASVPQPRDSNERPAAVGSARPVTGSASVPNIRVNPADAAEMPPPAAAPQARVYGRPASAPPADTETPAEGASPSGGFPATPSSDFAPPPGNFSSSPSGGFPASPSGGFAAAPQRDDELPQRGGQEQPGANLFPPRADNGAFPPPGPDSPNPFAPQSGDEPNGGQSLPQRSGGTYGTPAPQRDEDPSPFGERPEPNSPFGARPGDNGTRPDDNGPFGARPDNNSPFGARPDEGPNGGIAAALSPTDTPGVAPQSPARATARASASARVTPPEAPGSGVPFPGGSPTPYGAPDAPQAPDAGPSPFGAPPQPGNTFGTPAAPSQPGTTFGTPAGPFGSPPQSDNPFGQPAQADSPFGQPAQGNDPFGPPGQSNNPFGPPPQAGNPFAPAGPANAPDQYNEHTTDVAGRAGSAYVPAPALPPMPGDPDPRMGTPGVYPSSPAAHATVTPPSPEDTTSWPGPGDDQGSFNQFKAADPPKPDKVNVRTVPVTMAVVLGATLLLGLVFGLVYLISGDGEFSVAEGQCVKRDGETPVVAECSEAGTYKVVSKAANKNDCADATQPYIVVPKGDGTEVLCLTPNA